MPNRGHRHRHRGPDRRPAGRALRLPRRDVARLVIVPARSSTSSCT